MIDSRLRRSAKKKPARRTTRRRRLMETLESRQLLASLAGEVWGDTNANGIREPGEEGIANVRVYLDANNNSQLDEGEQFTNTNELGQYAFDLLAAGSHTVRLDLGESGATQSSPGSYYGTGYTIEGTGQTQLYQMSPSGEVTPIGVPHSDRMHGLARTNSGDFFGVNFLTDSIYTIDGETGVDTVLSNSGQNLVGGLAYDPVNDTVYTLAEDPTQPNHQILQEVDQATGALTPIGPGLSDLNNTSDLTFDTVNNRIVGFDNNDDEFFEFDLDGNGVSLSNTAAPLDSWSLAFNGTEFVMFDRGDAAKTAVLTVDPDTGATSPAFQASTRIPTEALLFANAGNSAQVLTLGDAEDARNVDFGIFGDSLGGGDGDGQLALGGFYINELVLKPLFGDVNTMQFVEIRGDDSAVLPDNAYFVVINDRDFNAGRIEQVFDLSNQPLGENGFLTLLQQGNPYSVDPGSTVLESDAAGFGGLPIFSDASLVSDNISTGSNSYFLIESDVAPVPGDDIDSDNNGQVDDAVNADWTVLDSVSVHEWVTGGDQAYGQVLLVEEGLGVPDPLEVPPGAEIVVGEGYGYAARIGDSLGSTGSDWVFGTVRDEASGSEPFRLGLEDGIFGVPNPTAFTGRDIDHVGDSNFVGGVRGFAVLDDPADPRPPAEGVLVFADENGNGVRDNLFHVVDPDAFPVDTDLLNLYPGVTLSTADTDTSILGFDVLGVQQTNGGVTLQNRIFSHSGIPFNNDFRKLRMDFYRPANAVSVQVIASAGSTPTYGRLDVYDENDVLLGTVVSNPLVFSSQERIGLSFESDVISYALAYADDDIVDDLGNPVSATPFGRFDEFHYRQFEASDVTDSDGFYEISNLFPNDYEVVYFDNPNAPILSGAQSVPITVTKYENFVLGPNDVPDAEDLAVTLSENAAAGTLVGNIVASDGEGGSLLYSIEAGDSHGIVINQDTGTLIVGPGADLDFESTPVVSFTVGVRDSLGALALVSVDITLDDVNEAPVVTNDPFTMPEDAEEGTAIGQIQAVDPDIALAQTLTYTVVGGSGAGIFVVNPDTGIVILDDNSSIDFESQPRLTLEVRVTDSADVPLSTTVVQPIDIVNANDPPVISTSSQSVVNEPITIEENSEGVVGQVFAIDPDVDQTHRFLVTGGTGTNFFNINNNGELFVKENAEVDFESNESFTLVLTVIDSGFPPLSDSKEITILIKDQNEPPVLEPSVANVPENSPAGTVVTTMDPNDPENAPANYALSLLPGDDADNFQLNSETNELLVAPGAQLDFEGQRTFDLVFEVVDTTGASPTIESSLTVILTDANDQPRIITERINVSELATPGSEVGLVRAADPDAGDSLTAEIVGGTAEALFELNPDTRVLTVADGASFDAEVDNGDLTLDITVTDIAGLDATKTIFVDLNDVNEPPVFGDTLDIPEAISGTPFSLTIPDEFIIDPEGRNFKLTIFDQQGVLPEWLTFDNATRTLSGIPNPTLQDVYTLTVHAFELGPPDLFNSFTFDLNVQDGDAPFTNDRDRLDVDANQSVRASDALKVLNFIAANGAGPISTTLDRFTGFVDVDGNGSVSVFDALLVINGLIEQSLAGEQILPSSVDDGDDRNGAVDAALLDLGKTGLF